VGVTKPTLCVGKNNIEVDATASAHNIPPKVEGEQ